MKPNLMKLCTPTECDLPRPQILVLQVHQNQTFEFLFYYAKKSSSLLELSLCTICCSTSILRLHLCEYPKEQKVQKHGDCKEMCYVYN